MANPEKHDTSAEFPVVGIGASAGGINALQTVFKNVPAKPNLAFVVVQHLAPDQPSQLASLIGGWTTLPVREVADGMKIERNLVFIAPPGQALTLEDGVFATKPLDGAGPRAGIDTIDSFFDSLAADCGRRAVAVILSGTGADGAAGAVRVKLAGGMVFVQDPTTAMHDGMPNAAIANGAADHIMPLGELTQELISCASLEYVRSESTPTWAHDVTNSLEGIIDLVRTRAGFDLTGYKRTPLVWRIQRRMETRHVLLFRDYEALLHDDPAELESLIRGIPIHVTEFFRDAQAWDILARDILPRLFSEAGDVPVRTWTPACATGEEAYSLAMLLAEQADAMKKPIELQMFATDASAEIVARASRGFFKATALNALSAERRRRFFYAVDGTFRVKRNLREKMIFAPQDLLNDPPFTNLDLVTCRNLLIYLEPDAIQRVVYLVHSSLRLGGYLLLGRGESLSPSLSGFEKVAIGTRVYRKTDRMPNHGIQFPKRPRRLCPSQSSLSAVEAHAREFVVESNDTPGVLMDKNFQILRIYGDMTPFLRFKAGEPTLNILNLLELHTRKDLEAAAQGALAEGSTVTVRSLVDHAPGGSALSLRVTPQNTRGDGETRILVSFVRSASPSGFISDEATDWSEALRISNQELEASREELQALNEELRASNDQLNLANDDLAAANVELKSKIQELATQSSVLSSGEVMTLFLDQDLRVRWFTPALTALFPLTPPDVGRPITDFAPRFTDPPFLDRVRGVMSNGELSEAEICNDDGHWYLERIRPFYAGNVKVDGAGVAITFTDISERRRAEDAAAEEFRNTKILQRLSTRLVSEDNIQTIYDELLIAAIDITRATAGMVQILDLDTGELVLLASRGFSQETNEHLHRGDAGSATSFGLALQTGARAFFDFDPASANMSIRWHVEHGVLSAQSSPLVSRSGKTIGMVSTHWAKAGHRPSERELRFLDLLGRQAADLIEQSRAETALRHSEQRRDLALEAAGMGAWDYDLVGNVCHFDARARDLYGLASDVLDHSPEGVAAVVHPDDVGPMFDAIRRASDVTGDGRYDIDYRIARADGTYRWLRAWGKTEFQGTGDTRRAVRIVGASRDVTVEKDAERQGELRHDALVASQTRLTAELAAAQQIQVVTKRGGGRWARCAAAKQKNAQFRTIRRRMNNARGLAPGERTFIPRKLNVVMYIPAMVGPAGLEPAT